MKAEDYRYASGVFHTLGWIEEALESDYTIIIRVLGNIDVEIPLHKESRLRVLETEMTLLLEDLEKAGVVINRESVQ